MREFYELDELYKEAVKVKTQAIMLTVICTHINKCYTGFIDSFSILKYYSTNAYIFISVDLNLLEVEFWRIIELFYSELMVYCLDLLVSYKLLTHQ